MTEIRSPSAFFRQRNLIIRIGLAVFGLLCAATAIHTQFDVQKALSAIPKVVVWIFENIVPDAKAWGRFPKMSSRLLDTILMSVMATTSAGFFSFFFALMGARSTKIHPTLEAFSLGIASLSRNIPVAAWAIIFLMTFGMSTFTGYLAIFFATFGFLTRSFAECIDQGSTSQVEALRATGASYAHIIVQGVVPSALPQMLSWVLYTVEFNIRDAALVGLLTGSGIGFLFDLYYKNQQYESASLVIFLLMISVISVEQLSNFLRRKLA